MNNSLERLYEGMAASLSERILPHVADDFARGQAYGIIYLLRCLSLRTDWSEAYLLPQWDALQAMAVSMRALLQDTSHAPAVDAPQAGSLHRRCETLRAALCEAYDWAEQHAGRFPPEALAALRSDWQAWIEADLKHELGHRVALPYSEMSTGHPATTDAPKASA